MSIVKIASFGYKIFVVLSSTQSIDNVGSLRQVRVKKVFFVVQYLTKKRIISIVDVWRHYTPWHARSKNLAGRSTALAPPCLLLCFGNSVNRK